MPSLDPRAHHMDVWRLAVLPGPEVKPVGSDSKDDRHSWLPTRLKRREDTKINSYLRAFAPSWFNSIVCGRGSAVGSCATSENRVIYDTAPAMAAAPPPFFSLISVISTSVVRAHPAPLA